MENVGSLGFFDLLIAYETFSIFEESMLQTFHSVLKYLLTYVNRYFILSMCSKIYSRVSLILHGCVCVRVGGILLSPCFILDFFN